MRIFFGSEQDCVFANFDTSIIILKCAWNIDECYDVVGSILHNTKTGHWEFIPTSDYCTVHSLDIMMFKEAEQAKFFAEGYFWDKEAPE